MNLSMNAIAPRFVVSIHNNRINYFQFLTTGISYQGVDYFQKTLTILGSAKLAKNGDFYASNLDDHHADDVFEALNHWRAAGSPSNWVCSFGSDYVQLKSQNLIQERIAKGLYTFQEYEQHIPTFLV
jgi:hypothetical protein